MINTSIQMQQMNDFIIREWKIVMVSEIKELEHLNWFRQKHTFWAGSSSLLHEQNRLMNLCPYTRPRANQNIQTTEYRGTQNLLHYSIDALHPNVLRKI